MTPAVRVGLSPSLTIWQRPVPERVALMQSIDDAGIDYVFFADHVSFRDGSGNDAMVQAAALANLHPTLGVYAGVYLLALRHPVPTARQLADLAVMAPGRVSFGIGVGGDDRHEIEVCGVDPATRGRRTDEAMEIVTRLLGGETVDFDGDFFQLEQATIRPAPGEPIPYYVGGRSDAAIRRAGRFGNGWIASWCSPRRFAEAAAECTQAAREWDRPAPDDHGLQVWVGLDADRNRARALVASGMEDFYKVPFEAFEKYTPYGSPAEVAEFLAGYVEAGCRHFNIAPCAATAEAGVALTGEVAALLRAR